MTELASKWQLRMSFIRWALVTVPAIVGIGSVIGILSNSGYANAWFVALDRPAIVPPGWVFGVVWTTLYTLIALAFAMVLHARGAPGRIPAIAAFLVQLLLNFCLVTGVFGLHQVSLALLLIGAILLVALLTTFLFGRIRSAAAWLMVPYLAWLSFATILNYQIDAANPNAETLAVPVASTDIDVGQGMGAPGDPAAIDRSDNDADAK